MSQMLNSLIPMEDDAGNRCFVNQWDVQARKAEGWKVIGRLEHHTASTKAPIEALTEGEKPSAGEKPPKGGKAKKADGPDAPSFEQRPA